ncbi:MAG: hypothetical protein HGA80_03685 [Candidatus Omnitrophica bacterium]|nr:hypothetical protein [Candidatus Omnitrophota bacterium]
MRTARYLKLFSYVLLGGGITLALVFLPTKAFAFWLLILGSVTGCLVLRLLAIMGQLLFEMRHDFARILSTMERSGQYANSLRQEIRDLLDEKLKA